MILSRIKRTISERGFILTLLLSMAILCFAYGRLLIAPNSKFFKADGDGLQAYYGAIYHIKHDSAYWRSYGMNHPYGEEVFFTGGQPLVSNAIKLISNVVDISGYTVGILNLIMLLSVVISALCLYLILKHFKIQWLYAAFAAVCIAFLSPQIDRFAGHFSLAYHFAIPAFILGLLKFHQAPSLRRSLALGLLCLFMAGTHFYFFAFYALLSAFYWIHFLFSEGKLSSRFVLALKHSAIQLFIPFLIIQALVSITDGVTDRTVFPLGYRLFVSNLSGVFFPPNCNYEYLFSLFWKQNMPLWEGRAYVGVVAVIASLGIFLSALRNLLNREYRNVFRITDQPLLNVFFWASVAGLLLSFGIPFMEHPDWLGYAGPLKQLRGIGRLAWLFYYVINIIAFYKFMQWAMERRWAVRYFLLISSIYFIAYDVWKHNDKREGHLNNEIAELQDPQNLLPADQWLKRLRKENYQAILPLPYFHVGSENIWINSRSRIVRETYIASIKTGLPMTSVILSRTSLSQTYKNIALVKEPYRPLEYLKDLRDKRPFLVLARPEEMNAEERALFSLCRIIDRTPDFIVGELEMKSLETISSGLYAKSKEKFESTKVYHAAGLSSADSLPRFAHKGFDSIPVQDSYRGTGCYEAPLHKYNVLYFDTIPNWKEEEYTVSFWMDRFKEDIYPRAIMEIAGFDIFGNMKYSAYFTLGEKMRVTDGDWALIEAGFSLKNRDDKIKVTVWTEDYIDEEMLLRADELLIKPASGVVYGDVSSKSITENNRTYLSQ